MARVTRDLDYFAARVAYPCIFADSVNDAAKNLANLIANRLGGLQEGVDAWRPTLDSFARNDDALDSLESMGKHMNAPFSRAEWRDMAAITLRILDSAGDE